MVIKFPVMNRDSWLLLRSEDLTASDVGAAAGVDPYKSPLTLYAEKTGAILPVGENPLLRRGRWLEPAVLQAIKETHPTWEVRTVGMYYRDPDLHLGATPDAVAVTDQPGVTNVQCKVVGPKAYLAHWSDGPPMNYLLQTMTEAMLMDADQSILAALVIDSYSADLYLHEVPRHPGAEQRIREIAKEFWTNVREGKRPAPKMPGDGDVIEALYPVAKQEPVLDLAGDNMLRELLAERHDLKLDMKEAEERIDEIDSEVKGKLGEYEQAVLPGWKISWPTQHRREYTVPAKSFRRLTITSLEETA